MRVDGREQGYVYVVLQGQAHDALAMDVSRSSVLRTTLWSIALVALLGLVAGLAAFALITRPLRGLTRAVRAFEGDDGQVAVFLAGSGRCLGLGQRSDGRLAPQRLFRWAAAGQQTEQAQPPAA